jgi:hypothetical protein
VEQTERQSAAEVAVDGESEPEPGQSVNYVNGLVAADVDGAQSDVADQPFGDGSRGFVAGGEELIGRLGPRRWGLRAVPSPKC